MSEIDSEKIKNDAIRLCELLQKVSTECVDGLKNTEEDADVALYVLKIWGAVEEIHPALTALCQSYKECP